MAMGLTTTAGFSVSSNLLYVAPIFTALHGMQTRSSNENSLRLSVRPSVKCVNCDKMKEKSVQIFIPYERTFNLVF